MREKENGDKIDEELESVIKQLGGDIEEIGEETIAEFSENCQIEGKDPVKVLIEFVEDFSKCDNPEEYFE